MTVDCSSSCSVIPPCFAAVTNPLLFLTLLGMTIRVERAVTLSVAKGGYVDSPMTKLKYGIPSRFLPSCDTISSLTLLQYNLKRDDPSSNFRPEGVARVDNQPGVLANE